MTCPNCNHTLADDAKFFPQCGTARPSEPALSDEDVLSGRLDALFLMGWGSQRVKSAYLPMYADEGSRKIGRNVLAAVRELLGGPKDDEIAKLTQELKNLRTKALAALDGEMGGDAGDDQIVEACSQWCQSVRALPEEQLDPESSELPEIVRALLQAVSIERSAAHTAVANARREALGEALLIVHQEGFVHPSANALNTVPASPDIATIDTAIQELRDACRTDACTTCGSADTDERGNCYACLAKKAQALAVLAQTEPKAEAELPKVGEAVEVVPMPGSPEGAPWISTTVSKVVDLCGGNGEMGFYVHGRCGLFLPLEEDKPGCKMATWRRVVPATRDQQARAGSGTTRERRVIA